MEIITAADFCRRSSENCRHSCLMLSITESVIPDYFKCAFCVLMREICKNGGRRPTRPEKNWKWDGRWLEFEIKLSKALRREEFLGEMKFLLVLWALCNIESVFSVFITTDVANTFLSCEWNKSSFVACKHSKEFFNFLMELERWIFTRFMRARECRRSTQLRPSVWLTFLIKNSKQLCKLAFLMELLIHM